MHHNVLAKLSITHVFGLSIIIYKLNIPIENINDNCMLKNLKFIKLSGRRLVLDVNILIKVINFRIESSALLQIISFHILIRDTRSRAIFPGNNNVNTNVCMNSLVPRKHTLSTNVQK